MSTEDRRETLFFYGSPVSATEAKLLADEERQNRNVAKIRDAEAFTGEVERCNRVVILDGVSAAARKKITDAYTGRVQPARGSDKWDGGVIVGAEFGTAAEAKEAGQYGEFKQLRPRLDPRASNTREKEKLIERPAEPEKTVLLQPTSEEVTGPKADPQEVSLKTAEENLRPKIEAPRGRATRQR